MFDELKRRFAATPVLAMWLPDWPTQVEVDVSGYAIGGVLSQKQERQQVAPNCVPVGRDVGSGEELQDLPQGTSCYHLRVGIVATVPGGAARTLRDPVGPQESGVLEDWEAVNRMTSALVPIPSTV